MHEPTTHQDSPPVGRRADEWWRGAVIYQVYPRSFQDSSDDGIGDLPGIIERLPYIADLGVDAVWISPFMRSPMKDFGYDVADYCDVDPVFGALSDAERLIERAHELGLKVMIDFVPSHTSTDHGWFEQSRSSRLNRKADWYVWAHARPDGMPPNNWLSIFGGVAWEWEPRRHQYYLHNFLKDQPDLNFHNDEVIEALLEQARFWFERGVDGLRVDAIDFGVHDPELRDNPVRPRSDDPPGDGPHSTPFDMQYQQFNKARPELADRFLKPLWRLSDSFGGRTLLGEISGDHALARMVEYSNGGGLDMAYSFDLIHCPPTAAHIRNVVETVERHLDAGQGWACWSFGNHDVPRSATRFGGPQPHPDLCALIPMLLTCLRGTCCIYQGEELGLTEADIAFEDIRDPVGVTFWPDNKGRDGCRTPMPWTARDPHGGFTVGKPWLPVPEIHLQHAVDVQEGQHGSVLARTRAFLRWRRSQTALVKGDIDFIDVSEPVLAFIRTAEGERLLCVFNLSDEAQTVALPGLASQDAGCPVSCGQQHDDEMRLPAYAGYVGRVI